MAPPTVRMIRTLVQPLPTMTSQQLQKEEKTPLIRRDGRSEKESSIMFVGICISVMMILAAPMIWVWMADRIKRRKLDPFRKIRDLERNKKGTSSNPPPYEYKPVGDSIWARQEQYKTSKPPKAITADQILGTDKASYLRRIVPQSEGSSQLLTVAPAHYGWARQRVAVTKDGEQCISPWDAEHAPNPVIFPWLQKGSSTPTSTNSESTQSLQIITRTDSSSSPGTSSPSEAMTRISADDRYLESEIEYITSSGRSEKSCELSDAAPEGDRRPAQPREAAVPTTSQPFDKASSPHYCDMCQTAYATQGQLNVHLNRKHRRRYPCQHCPSAFALKADLRRHERSVHKDMYMAQAFYCPNPMCTIPHKTFARKDNLERHARRCRNRVSK